MARDVGIIAPEALAGADVERLDNAHAGRRVDHATDLDRLARRVARPEIVRPGEVEPADILVVDLGQWAEMLLAEGAAIGWPVITLVAVEEQRVVGGDRVL